MKNRFYRNKLERMGRFLQCRKWLISSTLVSVFHQSVLFPTFTLQKQNQLRRHQKKRNGSYFSLPMWLNMRHCFLCCPSLQCCRTIHHLQDQTQLQEPDSWRCGKGCRYTWCCCAYVKPVLFYVCIFSRLREYVDKSHVMLLGWLIRNFPLLLSTCSVVEKDFLESETGLKVLQGGLGEVGTVTNVPSQIQDLKVMSPVNCGCFLFVFITGITYTGLHFKSPTDYSFKLIKKQQHMISLKMGWL